MNQLFEVKGRKIGEGKPLVCVPIMGKTKEEILREAERLKDLGADLRLLLSGV